MKKLLILLVLCASAANAQQQKVQVNHHLVSLENENDTSLDYRYFVEKVYDGRQNRKTIGTALKGPFNARVQAKFTGPFEQEISGYLNKVLLKTEGKLPISIRINDLYISELSTATGETGYATVVMDVIENKEGTDYVMATLSSNVKSRGLDVTHKHDERIKEAVITCISKYEILRDDEKSQIPFRNYEVAGREVPEVPARGVYFSYAEMLNNTPTVTEGFTLEADDVFKDVYHLVNDTTGLPSENYYAYSDGRTLYLNVSRFAIIKHYARAERMGNKYFLRDIAFDITNALNSIMGIGSMVGSPLPGATVCILVDCTTGEPVFLSNSEVKGILSSSRQLLKEYKKSERTSEDIRHVLHKFYNGPQQ